MIDTLVCALERARSLALHEELELRRDLVLITLHRPANVDESGPLSEICRQIGRLARDADVVFPVHPRTRKMLDANGLTPLLGAVRLLEPLGYVEFLSLLVKAKLVITDSGGVQEEACFLRIPCRTLRPNTERPITISSGSNRLVTTSSLFEEGIRALDGAGKIEMTVPELWDGHSAARVVDALEAFV